MAGEPKKPRQDPGLFGRLQEDLAQRERMAGLTPVDLLELPRDERRVVQALARKGELELDELAAAIDMEPAEAEAVVESLREEGFVRVIETKGKRTYKTYFGRRRAAKMPLDIWQKLSDRTDQDEDGEEER